jgi:hypothetical protein
MMKTTKLLTTTAAVLFVAGGVAWAQNAPKGDAPAPERAPAAQQHAPAEKMAPSMKAGERKGSVTTGQDQGEKIQSNQNKTQVQEKSNLNAKPQRDEHGANRDMKRNEQNANRENRENKTGAKVDEKSSTKSSATNDKTRHETTAQGSVATGAKLSTEQRTRIKTVFSRHRVAPAHLNISIRVGVRVPETVHFYPVPVEVVEIYPEWRGYDYILVGDQILIIDPRSHLIVAILEA